jgi:hypothetical protein
MEVLDMKIGAKRDKGHGAIPFYAAKEKPEIKRDQDKERETRLECTHQQSKV